MKMKRTDSVKSEPLQTADLPPAVSVAVIGGGMAGLCGAIAAAVKLADPAAPCRTALQAGRPEIGTPSVLVLDAGTEPAKKLLVTGNGRCNVTNLYQHPACYRTEEPAELERFGIGLPERSGEVIRFLQEELHVLCHDRNGYVYPRTDQAGTVQRALLNRCRELGISLCSGVRVRGLRREEQGTYLLETGTHQVLRADAVLLAAGGMVSALYGCTGDGYRLAKGFGHRCAPPAPALCELRVCSENLKRAAGIRTHGRVSLRINAQEAASSEGELQLGKETISGIPVFQISHFAGRAFAASAHRLPSDRETPAAAVTAVLDFLPEVSDKEWERERLLRLQNALLPQTMERTLQDFCLGLLPDRAAAWLIADLGGVPEQKLRTRYEREGRSAYLAFLHSLLDSMRCKELVITGTADYEKAQVTSGGILLSELSNGMESRLSPGLFLAGEVLDVDGICGGYNLTFALYSGRIAGKAAAERALQHVLHSRTESAF